MSPSLYY